MTAGSQKPNIDTRIEQHIARGWEHQRIADKLGVDVAYVDSVRAFMDEVLVSVDSIHPQANSRTRARAS